MTPVRPLILAALVSVTIVAAPVPARAGVDERCYRDWSEAGPVVRAEGLLPVADVLKSVLRDRPGRAIKVSLCRSQDEFHYNVALSGRGGRILWVTVDARSGRIQPLVRR